MAIDDFIFNLFSDGAKANDKTKLSFFDLLQKSAPWTNLLNKVFTKSSLLSDLSSLGSNKWNSIFPFSDFSSFMNSYIKNKTDLIFPFSNISDFINTYISPKTDLINTTWINKIFDMDTITGWFTTNFNDLLDNSLPAATVKTIYERFISYMLESSVDLLNNIVGGFV